MTELTKLKSKEVDLPFLFKDTLSDCRWIEYCSGGVICDLIRYMYSIAYRRGGQAEPVVEGTSVITGSKGNKGPICNNIWTQA